MSILLDKVNADAGTWPQGGEAPVMATPAAFVAGVKVGAKVGGALVAAAAGGAAIAAAQNGGSVQVQ